MRETSLVSVARSILICSLSPLGSLSLAKCCQRSIEASAPARRWISSAKDSATAIFEDAHFARALLNRMVDQRLAACDMRGPQKQDRGFARSGSAGQAVESILAHPGERAVYELLKEP
jgi:hypothetical protein